MNIARYCKTPCAPTFAFFVLFIAASTVATVPATGQSQYRAVQSTAGGTAQSNTYTVLMTFGEPIPGAAVSAATTTVLTGFARPGGDIAGPTIAITSIGDSLFQPPISLEPIIHPASEQLTVQARIADPSGVEEATFFFRQGGTQPFSSSAMTPGEPSTYQTEVPGNQIADRGLEYYITALDSLGNPRRSPSIGAYGVRVRLPAPGLQQPIAASSAQSGYQLVSTPLQLADPSSSTVLASLGAYDSEVWRLWSLKSNYAEFTGADQYQEHRTGVPLTPGSAFWLISRDGGTLSTEEATTISTLQPFSIVLHDGWNFVSNPFNFDVPRAQIFLDGVPVPENRLKAFQNGWINSPTMQPFKGYAVDAGEGGSVTLTIDPAPDLREQARKTPGLAGPGETREEAPMAYEATYDWAIRIRAETRTAFDTENFLAVSGEASPSWDRMDLPEPPVIGEFVSVYFPHREWGTIHARYEADVRPPPVQGDTWRAEVATGTPQIVTLSFEGISDVPARYSIQLIDERTQSTLDLRQYDTHTVRSAGYGEGYPLSIVVGLNDFVEDHADGLGLVPGTFELDQNYPNPFNPTTSIRYGVSSASTVTLEVYNLVGQVVATLVDQEWKDAGYHVSTWDARADDGSQVASGLYLYKISVAPTEGSSERPFTMTRKMMLIK